MLKTNFWKNAAASLPSSVRSRYLADIEQAERWELALDAAIEVLSRVKGAFARSLERAARRALTDCLAVRANPTPPPPPLARARSGGEH